MSHKETEKKREFSERGLEKFLPSEAEGGEERGGALEKDSGAADEREA